MSDPPSPDSQPPEQDQPDGARRRLERLIPVLIKRLVEVGSGRLGERPEALRQLISELKLPKEALSVVLGQLEDTKNGISAAVAREVRAFLERSNLAEELTRALTRLSFEIKTEIRFVPNAQHGARPSVRAQTKLKRDALDTPADPPDDHHPRSEDRSSSHEPLPASRDEAADRRARATKEELE